MVSAAVSSYTVFLDDNFFVSLGKEMCLFHDYYLITEACISQYDN